MDGTEKKSQLRQAQGNKKVAQIRALSATEFNADKDSLMACDCRALKFSKMFPVAGNEAAGIFPTRNYVILANKSERGSSSKRRSVV
jgi:hypothetical protein